MDIKARAREILSKMTLEEKIGQVSQLSYNGHSIEEATETILKYKPGSFILCGSALGGSESQKNVCVDTINRLQKVAVEQTPSGVPLLFGRDVIHGHKVAFPVPLTMAASFDFDLIEECYDAIREEAVNDGIKWTFTPMIDMSREHRMQCLEWLKGIGYQTGTGIMVGSPGQTIDHLVEDLLFIERFQPEMIGIGPFIPHADTPFANEPAGSIDLTLKLISIFRLMHPSALIPATTALASLSPNGREQGILAGANVVMPNLSPSSVREKYSLYNHKAAFGSEAAEGLKLLEEQLNQIGYTISRERGDYKHV